MATKLARELARLRADLSETIIGQPEAINTIMGAIERYQAGLHDGRRPLGVFLFLGPTGVGKTYTVETLARLIQPKDAYIKLDCSEFTLEHEVSKLLGSPPGYVGHDAGSYLTRMIEGIKDPEQGFILLLDEVEKAHPRFFDLWLQVMDAGILTDSKGKKLDFTKALIFMTSNVGARHYAQDREVGFRSERPSAASVDALIQKELKTTFRPEFLNRLTGKVHFTPLTAEQQQSIFENMIKDLNARLARYYIKVNLGPGLAKRVFEKGFSKEYGARELKRALITEVEQPLAHFIVEGQVPTDSFVILEWSDALNRVGIEWIGEFPVLELEAA